MNKIDKWIIESWHYFSEIDNRFIVHNVLAWNHGASFQTTEQGQYVMQFMNDKYFFKNSVSFI